MVETLKVTSAKGEEKRLFNAKEESIKTLNGKVQKKLRQFKENQSV